MKTKESKGITILALVITIIVLLILAGIIISAITGNNGIIGNIGKAKEDTEIANEKGIVEKATIQAMGNNKYGHIEESELQEQLDKETGEGKTEASNIGDEFEVIFIESKRYYIVEEEGNVQGEYLIIEDKHPGDITINRYCNKANIMSEEDRSKVGGICGSMNNGNLTVINSYNAEQIKINGNTAGGIIGFVYDHTRCINVYSTGNITGTTIGGIVGAALWNNASQNKFENCYFLKSSTVQQSAGKNIAVNATMLEELTNETIDELNTYITNNSTLTSEWKKWTIENRNPQFMKK